MKVADLAAELEIPASMVLDQCQRFGIDAAWAGAELSGADVVVLRTELAAADPIDLRDADEPESPPTEAIAAVEVPPAAATPAVDAPTEPSTEAVAAVEVPPTTATPAVDAPTALPPTAVGSMPELIDEVTPEAAPEEPSPAAGLPSASKPGFAMAGASGVDPNAERRVPPRTPPAKRRMERSVRNAAIALVLAVAAFVASNYVDLAAVVGVLWFIAAVGLCVAVVDGVRGRNRVQTHPERVHGLWLSTITIVLAIGGLIGLTASVFAVIGDDPAADAPLGVGDLASVQVARWGYERADRFSENGWHQPAREQGTCWERDAKKERDVDRVEVPDNTDLTKCDRRHTLEVARVFAFNRDADAPYPSAAAIMTAAQEQCGKAHEDLVAAGETVELGVELPTEVGWGSGDHDIACVYITPERKTPLS